MPNAQSSRAIALLLAMASVTAALLVLVSGPSAAAADVRVPGVTADIVSSSDVSTNDEPVTTSQDPSADPLGKIAPGLHEAARNPSKGYVDVVVHTSNVPAASALLASVGARKSVMVDGEIREVAFVARPWGAVGRPASVQATIPQAALAVVAASQDVLFIDQVNLQTVTFNQDEAYDEERLGIQNYVAQVKAGNVKTPIKLQGSQSTVSPTSWAIAREHKAYDAWQLGFQGDGVNVAVVDTGEDFGHPSLMNSWAVAPSGPWAGWPIMFHPASMEGMMGNGWWTAGSDLERLPLPFWLRVNDGDSWYTNTDYKANDTDLDGFLVYADGTAGPDFETGYTPQENPQGYGGCGSAARINRDYWIGMDGDPDQIRSASGIYRLGLNRDDTLTGLYCEKVGILVVDSTTFGVYDTVYVDLDFDFDFTNDKALTQADPLAVADIYDEISGGPGQDGVADVSGGLLFFIANSQQISNEVVIAGALGTEMSATLANGWVATDINGRFSFVPPTQLWLRDSLGFPNYFPGKTEDIYEEFTGLGGDDSGRNLPFGTGSFPPVNLITFQSVPTGVITRGPGPNFAVDFIWYAEECDPTFTTCTPLVAGTDYTLNAEDGSVLVERDIPNGFIWYFIYQLDTYLLETVSGTIALSRAMPAGWDLVADYQTGLPVPYSQIYGPDHGYDTFIPANGDLVAFHGEFDYQQSHGSFVSSTIAAHPFGNLASGAFEVFGTAPRAKIIGIAACCNAPGPVGLFGSIEDQRTFAALGYDGIAGTGDEAVILSNSFGSTQTINTGFSWEDRWLIDFWTRYPELTTLIALGNNGPGYGTNAPGGSSPGVIGVGAGNSGDYRVLFGFDGGDAAWEMPVCPPPPVDPATCVGVGSPFGPGPYGDPVYFSSRGPTMMGTPKPDIMSIGAFGLEAAPLNVYCFGDPTFCDGNFAFDLFSGTSQATPVTAGVTALIVQAYRSAHGGANPTNDVVKSLLKSGADDIHRDVLQQGAGWTNALRSVEMALESSGVSSDRTHWTPGDYQGLRRVGFVNLMAAGDTDQATFAITNHNPVASENVQISDAVYTRSGRFTYSFSLATGTGQHYILRPTGAYGAAGVYSIAGNVLLSAMPFDAQWAAADFVKVTYTYDAIAYTDPTSWRLDTFNWYDDNADGVFGGFAERNRMTVAVNGAGAHSVWETTYDPDNRIIDGWVLNPRSGAAAPIPATLIVEFYEKSNWAWITTSVASLNLGAGGTSPFTATATIPAGTPAGMYEGAIYLTDFSGDVATIPIVINVPISSFPVVLGGNVPATSLYDNNGVIQGSRSASPWRQTGDSRYVYADVTVAANVGRNVLYQAVLSSTISDPEMYVYQLGADASWPDDAVYGPGAFTLVKRTEELIGSTKTNFVNMELMASPLQPPSPTWSAFIAFQVKAWGSMGDADAMQANIGIMEVAPTQVDLVTNSAYGLRPISVWANVPLYNGIDTLSAQVVTTTTNFVGETALQDNPNDPWTSSWTYAQVIPAGQLLCSYVLAGLAGDDLDFFLMRDSGAAGNPGALDPTDPIVRSSAGGTADESFSYPNPVPGNYWVAVHGWSVPGGSTTFNASIQCSSVVILPSAYTDRNAPTVTVPANTPSGFNLEWRHPQDAVPATQSGVLYVSPGFAPLALVQLLTISWVYDTAAPTINTALDLSPLPNTVIADTIAGVVANVGDSRGVDRFSAQLLVDGVDVSSEVKIVAPFPYTLVTVAWEHRTQPWDDGRHSAVLNIRDVAGNLKTQVWSWTVDTTGPTVSVTSPSADALTNAATWAFTAETEAGATVTVTVNGVAATVDVTLEGRITGTLNLAEGTNAIAVTATDALGNVGMATRTVVRDSTAPVITALADRLSPTNAESTTVTGTVDEDVIAVWVNGMAAAVAADGTFSATIPLSEGSNLVTVLTWDAAGNQGTANLPAIVRDTVAPTVTVSILVAGQPAPAVIRDLATTTVTITGTAPDADVFFVTINGQSVGVGGPFTRDFTLAVGDNVFVVQAIDDAGNVGMASATVSYAPVAIQERANYNSIIASGVAVVLLIVGFVVGYLLSGRGGGPEAPAASGAPPMRKEPLAEEELPSDEATKMEEEEL